CSPTNTSWSRPARGEEATRRLSGSVQDIGERLDGRCGFGRCNELRTRLLALADVPVVQFKLPECCSGFRVRFYVRKRNAVCSEDSEAELPDVFWGAGRR